METIMNVVTWLVDLLTPVVAVLSPAEWKAFAITLGVTFAATYTLKLIYKAVVNEPRQSKQHIRVIAIVAGLLAAWRTWPPEAANMQWLDAGVLMGPLSILIHMLMAGIAKWGPVKKRLPFIHDILKGERTHARKT